MPWDLLLKFKTMYNARRRPAAKHTLLDKERWSHPFRPKLDAVGRTTKCRFLRDHYDIVRQIGEGTYGQVFVAVHRDSGQEVALKKIRMDSEKDGFPITAVREIKILKSADHENVIRLREIIRSSPEENAPAGSRCGVYMVFDFMEHDLTGYCEQMQFQLPLGEVKFFMKQLLKGLNACHVNGILHRDLKLSNLLINREGKLKIADFGLARPYQEFPDSKMTNRVITLWYRPPELMMGAETYGTAIDMWSVGCIFAELLAGKALFPGKDEIDQLDKIFALIGPPNEQSMPGCTKLTAFQRVDGKKYKEPKLAGWCRTHKVDPQAQELLRDLLSLNPKCRPSAYEALKHPFFSSEPKACHPDKLKYMAPSHEYTVKRKRNEANQAAAQQHEGRDNRDRGYGEHRPYKRYASSRAMESRSQHRRVNDSFSSCHVRK